MATHTAVVTVAARAPLEITQVPTVTPQERQVRVKVEWTASTPLDLHQADGGLLVQHPQLLGDGVGGTVVEVGPDVTMLAVGDVVFGFTWRNAAEKAFQEFVTAPEFLLGKGFTLQEAVTLPNNLVTAFHTITTNLKLPLPWPRPQNYQPPHKDDIILIWGGSSSVGQYALQVLHYYGYTNLYTTASKTHHPTLKSMGATQVFDYRDSDVISSILDAASSHSSAAPRIPFIIDCIGSQSASIAPISRIAEAGSTVAILLPVIIKDATESEAPEYGLDVQVAAKWADGVEAEGVRTHFYLDNEFFKEHLQSEIMPALLASGIVKPNKQRIVEGSTLLERAQTAIDLLRQRAVSGERLVWRVSEPAD